MYKMRIVTSHLANELQKKHNESSLNIVLSIVNDTINEFMNSVLFLRDTSV
jgi:hypothetical protein